MSTRKTFIIGDPNDPAKRFYVDSSTNHVGMNVYPDDGYTLFVNQETHAESGAAKFSGDVLIDDASLNVSGSITVDNDADITGNLSVNGNLNVDNTITVGSITDLESYVSTISTNLSNLSQNKIEDTGSSSDVTVGTNVITFDVGGSEKMSINTTGINIGSITDLEYYVNDISTNLSNLSQNKIEDTGSSTDVTVGTSEVAFNIGSSQPLIVSESGSTTSLTIDTDDVTIKNRTTTSDSTNFLAINSNGEIYKTSQVTGTIFSQITSLANSSGSSGDNTVLETISIYAPTGDLLDNSMSTFVNINSGETTFGGGISTGREMNITEEINFVDGSNSTGTFIENHEINSESNLQLTLRNNNDTSSTTEKTNSFMVKQYNSTNNYTDLIGAYSNFYNNHAVTLGNVQFRYIYISNDPTYNLSIKEIECWINNSNVASSGTPYSTQETSTTDTTTSETTLSNSIDGNTSTSMTLTDTTYGSYLLKLNQNYNLSDLQRIIIFNNGGADYSSGVNSIQLLDENKNIISWVDHSSGQTLTNTSSISYINYIGVKDDVINDVSYNIYTSNNLNYVFTNYYNNTFTGDTGIVGDTTMVGNLTIYDGSSKTPKIILSESIVNGVMDENFVIEYEGTLSGTGNYVTFYSGYGSWAAKGTSLNIVPQNGNVGIGKTDPSYKFQVNGTTYISGATTLNSGLTVGSSITSNGSDFILWNATRGGSGTSNGRALVHQGNGTKASSVLNINYSSDFGSGTQITGNLGVNTGPSSSYTLDLNGTALIRDDLTISNPGEIFFGSTTRQMLNLWGTAYGLGVQSSTFYFRTGNHFAWHKGGSHSDSTLDAGTGGSTLMTLRNTGRLGIGSTDPGYTLDVNGTAYISDATTIGGELEIKADDGTSQKDLKIFNGDLYIQNDSDSLSGTGTPHINFCEGDGYTTNMSIFYDGDNKSNDNNYIGFKNKEDDYIMSVTYGGNVGIGTISPTVALDVNGDGGKINGVPITCGIAGFMVDSAYDQIHHMNQFHIIYGSMSTFHGWQMHDRDDVWHVFPGYKFIIYTGASYTGSTITFDNTNASYVSQWALSSTNATSSIKVYYHGVEVTTGHKYHGGAAWNNSYTG